MAKDKNVFERVAESWEQDEMKAFTRNPPAKNYMQLTNSTEVKEVGRRFPQISYINVPIAHFLEPHQFPPFPVRFDKIEVYKTSKLTDCLSTTAISAPAFILSQRALTVFNKFNLGRHQVYPATVYHKGIAYPYGVLHFINNHHDNLDFSSSRFYVANIMGGYEFDIDITDRQDFEAKNQLVKAGKWPSTEEWWSVNLKWGVFNSGTVLPDIYTIRCSSIRPYISGQLAQAILANRLTGFKMKEVYNLQG